MNINKLKRKVKKVLKYYHKRVIILMYHRVVNITTSPYHVIVSIEHFEQQMKYVREYCHPLSLTKLVEAIQNDALPQKGIVVTFDDGYKDNYQIACPILQRFEIPATFFITTDHINSKREYWWDELERIILFPENSLNNTRLKISQHGLDLNLSNLNQEQKFVYLKGLHAFLKTLSPNQRNYILNTMAKSVGLSEYGREEYLPMTKHELLQLSQNSLFSIGAHTKGHPMLSSLRLEEQRDEIMASKTYLENILGQPVNTFAYPYGSSHDFNAESVGIIHSGGFHIAVSTIPGVVDSSSDIANLPRIWIGDWNIKYFSQTLEKYLI